jgi:hypothetical protein
VMTAALMRFAMRGRPASLSSTGRLGVRAARPYVHTDPAEVRGCGGGGCERVAGVTNRGNGNGGKAMNNPTVSRWQADFARHLIRATTPRSAGAFSGGRTLSFMSSSRVTFSTLPISSSRSLRTSAGLLQARLRTYFAVNVATNSAQGAGWGIGAS